MALKVKKTAELVEQELRAKFDEDFVLVEEVPENEQNEEIFESEEIKNLKEIKRINEEVFKAKAKAEIRFAERMKKHNEEDIKENQAKLDDVKRMSSGDFAGKDFVKGLYENFDESFLAAQKDLEHNIDFSKGQIKGYEDRIKTLKHTIEVLENKNKEIDEKIAELQNKEGN